MEQWRPHDVVKMVKVLEALKTKAAPVKLKLLCLVEKTNPSITKLQTIIVTRSVHDSTKWIAAEWAR